MKKTIFQIKFAILFVTVFSLSLNATSLSQFTGNWKNVKSNSRGITKIILSQNRGLKIQVFGSCSPKDCDWGTQKAFAYGRSVSSNTKRETKVITATYKKGFSITQLILKLRRNRLTVETFTRFTDGTKRSNYTSINTFVRDIANLRTPILISPRNNTVFNNFPRKTTLRWKRVKGAVEYGVEIDCLGCCKAGKWCFDVNRKAWKSTKTRNRSFTFNYVGAQSGRWRVWAIAKDGRKSPKSRWRKFRYTR